MLDVCYLIKQCVRICTDFVEVHVLMLSNLMLLVFSAVHCVHAVQCEAPAFPTITFGSDVLWLQNTPHDRFFKLLGGALAVYLLWPVLQRDNALRRRLQRMAGMGRGVPGC